MTLHALNEGPPSLTVLWPVVVLGLSLLVLHIAFSCLQRPPDQLLLPLAGLLTGLGLLMALRLGGDWLLRRQLLWAVLGTVVLGAIVFVPQVPVLLKRYHYSWAFFGLALVILTIPFGYGPGPGAPRLWLAFGPLSFQPSEPLKVLLVLFFASYLADHQPALLRRRFRWGPLPLPPLPYLLPLASMAGLALVLLIGQRDLGVAFLLSGIFVLLLSTATGQKGYLLAGLVGMVAAGYLAYHASDVVYRRVSVWLDPWSDASGAGYQVVQGLIALASGGLLGRGLGHGLPEVLPAAHTDYVFVALAEELGAAGAVAVTCLYLLFFARGLQIAREASSPYFQLLAAGSTLAFALQTFLLLGGNLGLLPLTGLPLPFLSYGGSAMLSNYALLGFLLLASRPVGPAAFQLPAHRLS